MANKLSDVGLRRRLTGAARRRIGGYLPPSFRSHLKASIRETFLAVESLFDEAIKSLEREERKVTSRKTKKAKEE